MIFIIDEEIYNKTHYCLYDPLNDIRFYFDYANYNLWDVADIENVEGMIPFVRIREVDVMKEFIVSLNDRKLLSKYTPLSDKEFWHQFWEYFDDDSVKSERWGEYDRNFRMDSIVKSAKRMELRTNLKTKDLMELDKLEFAELLNSIFSLF